MDVSHDDKIAARWKMDFCDGAIYVSSGRARRFILTSPDLNN